MSDDVSKPHDSIASIFERENLNRERECEKQSDRLLNAALRRIRQNTTDPQNYSDAASCYQQQGQWEDAVALLYQSLDKCGPSHQIYRKTIHLLERLNRTEEAAALARYARRAFPGDLLLAMKEHLLLPLLYESTFQLHTYRTLYAEGLSKLKHELSLQTLSERTNALLALEHHESFLLAYQGNNDRELQISYATFVSEIMAANFPRWTVPVPMPETNESLRIGYVSAHFRQHSVSKLFLSWLRRHNRDRIEVFAYNLGRVEDSWTRRAARLCNGAFRHVPHSLEAACMAILEDRLHVVIFLDIGMHPRAKMIAALRVAPVQCVTWGHPTTTGLRTVDYFISSETMEPGNRNEHYSEQILTLPGVGVCYDRPAIPWKLTTRTRHDFNIREDAIVYLCCQSVFKYLPAQDALFAEIAQRVPTAQFVFLSPNPAVSAHLHSRLSLAFSAAGLDASESCVILPEVRPVDYWNLNIVSDVFLDTIGWSGGVTTFEAIACALPVVTVPGTFMRGRHSFAMLSQLNVTETIASNEAEYVDIAVRLGLEREWRLDVRQRMTKKSGLLYSDARCIASLNDFIERVVS